MIMKIRCLTNNPLVINRFLHTEKVEGETLEVLQAVKGEITKGYKLITHPLTGSIRPDISPYKSVVISKVPDKLDIDSLKIIENAIEYTLNLLNMKAEQKWDEKSLRDFQLIDFCFLEDLLKDFQ